MAESPASADAESPAAAPAPPEGTLTFDAQALFESQVMAYEQMLGVTEIIGRAVQELVLPPGSEPTYVVVTAADLDALALLGAVGAAARTLATAFAGVAPAAAPAGGEARMRGGAPRELAPRAANLFSPVGQALEAVRGVLQAAAGVAALFRRDVTITNSAVQVDGGAFALQVAGELANRGLRVRVPGVYAPAPAGDADPFAALDAAFTAAAEAAVRVAARPEEARAAEQARLDALRAALARLEAVAYGGGGGGGGGGAAGDAADAAGGAASAGGAAATVLALRRAGALAAAVGPGTVLVRPEVIVSGGSRRQTRGGIKGMLGTALELSGGLVASVAVFTHDGLLVGAGTWTRHSGYQAFEGRPR